MKGRHGRQEEMPQGEVLLAIESSCDETAAAVVSRDLQVLSNIVASQHNLHGPYDGVVPEIASRAHVRNILPTIDAALNSAGVKLNELELVAVVTQPGLVGSLLVGLTAAKSIAVAFDLPLVAVNHIEAHLYACRMSAEREVFPAVGLVVSGGHTNLYDCRSGLDMRLVGSTIDDAAGEAFDKVASILGLSYPGGPSIERKAHQGRPDAFDLPRPLLKDKSLDFSFSGLKTAVLYQAKGTPGSRQAPVELTDQRVADLAASFQEAVTDVIVEKSRQALRRYGHETLCVGGGVAANNRLRERLEEMAGQESAELILAPLPLCTDNAAMAAVAWEHYAAGNIADLNVDVMPGLVRRNAR